MLGFSLKGSENSILNVTTIVFLAVVTFMLVSHMNTQSDNVKYNNIHAEVISKASWIDVTNADYSNMSKDINPTYTITLEHGNSLREFNVTEEEYNLLEVGDLVSVWERVTPAYTIIQLNRDDALYDIDSDGCLLPRMNG